MTTATTLEFLDVSRLPDERTLVVPPGGGARLVVSMSDIVYNLRNTLEAMQHNGLLRLKNDKGERINSFGYAMSVPGVTILGDEDPYEFTWLVAGWGPDKDKYIANAVRKLRPAVRLGADTLLMKRSGLEFRDVVPSVDDEGRFPWGDFPHGGAVKVRVGMTQFFAAVSCYREDEDVLAANLVGTAIGVQIERAANNIAA